MAKFKVLVPLWVDGYGAFAEGSEQDFAGVDEGLVAGMVQAGQVVPLGEWQPPVVPEPEPVEVVETHPHHVGGGKPAPGTWEAVWSEQQAAKRKGGEGA